MATLIPAGGAPQVITPAGGAAEFTLPELQRIVRGYIEAVYLPVTVHERLKGQPGYTASEQRLVMFVNENGKSERLPVNHFATFIARPVLRPDDWISGDVVVCTFAEAGEHGDES